MSSGRPLVDAHRTLRLGVCAGTAVLLCAAWLCPFPAGAAEGNAPSGAGSVLIPSAAVPLGASEPVGTGVRPSGNQPAYFAEPTAEAWPGEEAHPAPEPFASDRRQSSHRGDDRYYGPEHLWEAVGLPIVIEVPAWAVPEPPLYHRNANDPLRHHGIGRPLIGTSWLNRPFSAGWFFGGLFGDGPINGVIKQDSEIFGGYRFGWDFDHYWGVEARFGVSHLPLSDLDGRQLASDAHVQFYDMHLLHYPWGDARWRPYWTVGLGVSTWDLDTPAGDYYFGTLFQIPIGLGVKYQWKKWLTFRLDLMDNIAIGDAGFNTMHNLSLTCGAEVRFGGWRRGYYPWNPSVHIW